MAEFIYGIRTLIEAVKSGKEIDNVFVKRGSQGELFQELMQLLKQQQVPVKYVPVEKIDRMTSKNHQGVLAFLSEVVYYDVAQIVPTLYDEGKVPLLLLLDRVTDVRNFGAIARTAECAGVQAIIVPDKNSAQINADAIKTSAGALHKIPVCRTKSLINTVKFLKDSGIQIVAASEKATDFYYEIDFKVPTAIVMGAEDQGISADILRFADKMVKIPMLGSIESLNVSAATAIFIYEAVKQRINNDSND